MYSHFTDEEIGRVYLVEVYTAKLEFMQSYSSSKAILCRQLQNLSTNLSHSVGLTGCFSFFVPTKTVSSPGGGREYAFPIPMTRKCVKTLMQ